MRFRIEFHDYWGLQFGLAYYHYKRYWWTCFGFGLFTFSWADYPSLRRCDLR